MKWTSVSPKYLGKHPTPEEELSWVKFLEKLGVRKYLVIEKVNVPIPMVSGLIYGEIHYYLGNLA